MWLGMIFTAVAATAADFPQPREGDFIIRQFEFESGEVLPELNVHYTTIGEPRRDESGRVRNAVLIMHGTTGRGGGFLSDRFAGQLFGPGQLLDVGRYFIILPDGIGHGKTSRPSDGGFADRKAGGA
jgi:homoserine O-acetyltransferase